MNQAYDRSTDKNFSESQRRHASMLMDKAKEISLRYGRNIAKAGIRGSLLLPTDNGGVFAVSGNAYHKKLSRNTYMGLNRG